MNENAIVRITEDNPEYTSMRATTKEEQKKLYNAIENPDGKISSLINKRIKIENIHLIQAEITERDDDGNPTGYTIPVIKSTIITDNGKVYFSTSKGIYRALVSMCRAFGTPDTWDEPMEVEIQQMEIGKNRTFKIKVV